MQSNIAVYSPHTAWDNAPHGIGDWLCGILPYSRCEIATPKPKNPEYGSGRIAQIDKKTSVTLREAVALIKDYLAIPHVQLAKGIGQTMETQIHSFAVCPGSGASVLRNVEADLYVTGEFH